MERQKRTEPRADKVAVVEEVEQRFAEAGAVLLTEYRGLDVEQLAELRGTLIEAETTYKVYKNSLVRRASQGRSTKDTVPPEFVELLVGPTALAFTQKDPAAAAKALADFAAENEELIIKGGILSGEFIDARQVRELAKLPPRDEVLAQLAGGLSAPLAGMAALMGNLLSGFAGLLDALAQKQPAQSQAQEQSPDEASDEEPDQEPEAEPVAEQPSDQPQDSAAAESPDQSETEKE